MNACFIQGVTVRHLSWLGTVAMGDSMASVNDTICAHYCNLILASYTTCAYCIAHLSMHDQCRQSNSPVWLIICHMYCICGARQHFQSLPQVVTGIVHKVVQGLPADFFFSAELLHELLFGDSNNYAPSNA